MQRIGKFIFLAAAVLLLSVQDASAANKVSVEDLHFQTANAAGIVIGVYIENDINIQGLTLPLEIRTVTGNAFITGLSAWGFNPGSRGANSPLGGAAEDGFSWPAPQLVLARLDSAAASNTCSGPTSNTFAQAKAQIGFTSPDCVFLASVSTGDPGIGEQIFLVPGADAPGAPSIRMTVTLNGNQGIFEIDSCCRTPANHVEFIDENVGSVTPQFKKGRIGIGVSEVKELETGVIPQDYALEQNYPNPFNAGTVIRFMVPTDGNVKIDVYNILGRRVRTLVDEFRSAGTHQTDWNGRSDNGEEVATGVYFYRITAENFTSTRKMVLLK